MTQKQTPHHTPPLRFPEFRGAGAWEVKKLGDMFKLYQPQTLSRSQLKQSGQYNVYGANGIIGRHDDYNHKDSEVIVTCRGATCGEIHYTEPEVWITGNAMVVKPKDDDLSKIFIMHYLKNHNLKSVISGSAQPQITREGLAPLPIALPPLLEQEKVAAFLSSLDEVIKAQAERLDVLTDYKRGLMQQLFPAKEQTTPTLRFPEFQGKDTWQEKPLGEVCNKITQGGTPDTSESKYWEGSINWLTPAEMGKTETRFMCKTVRTITELGLKKCSSDLLPINSVIISTRAPIGHLAINKTEMAINQGCKGLVPNKTTSYDFLYYTLLFYKNSLMDLGAGSTFKELTGNNLKSFKVAFPSFEEQQKIADCLSLMDESITTQKSKVKILKNHKNGLMQQLFPAL